MDCISKFYFTYRRRPAINACTWHRALQPSSDHDACGVGFIAHTARPRRPRHRVARPRGAAAPDPPRRRRVARRGRRLRRPHRDSVDLDWRRASAAGCRRRGPARSACCSCHPSDRLHGGRDRRARAARRRRPLDRLAHRADRPRGGAARAARHDADGAAGGRRLRRRRAQTADAALYRARLRIERIARDRRRRGSPSCSLSTRTVVHKALVTPDALDRFFPDLADARFVSPFITFHQRFSTNTSADWALAQPFRTLAHNGEINTIAGNRLWMRARAADATALPGFGLDPPISDARLRLAVARRCDRAAAAQRLLARARGHAAGAAGVGARPRPAARRPRLLRVPVAGQRAVGRALGARLRRRPLRRRGARPQRLPPGAHRLDRRRPDRRAPRRSACCRPTSTRSSTALGSARAT